MHVVCMRTFPCHFLHFSAENQPEVAAPPAAKTSTWPRLLDSDDLELQVYQGSSSHIDYLKAKGVESASTGCFIVSAKGHAKGKPLPIAAGLLVEPMVSSTQVG